VSRGGFVKLHRVLLDHPIWLSGPFSLGQAFADIFGRANYRPSRVLRGRRWIDIERGQLFTTILALSARWHRDAKTVRTWLSVLKADGMIDIRSEHGIDGGFTLITVMNYDEYQGADSPTDSLSDSPTDSLSDSPTDSRAIPHRNGQRTPVRTPQPTPHFKELKNKARRREGKNGATAPALSSAGLDAWDGVEPGRADL
jgi:hypothetical protein